MTHPHISLGKMGLIGQTNGWSGSKSCRLMNVGRRAEFSLNLCLTESHDFFLLLAQLQTLGVAAWQSLTETGVVSKQMPHVLS